jgi:hypothetical protein
LYFNWLQVDFERWYELVMVPGLLGDVELWAHQTPLLGDIADCQAATATVGQMAGALPRQSLFYD